MRKAASSPDAVNQTGQSTGLAARPPQGGYDLDEAYAELEVPILADMPFAKELAFNVASRYSKYSNFGNTTNSKFQMRWRPIDGLLVRATYAEGFRAPAIADLFGGTGAVVRVLYRSVRDPGRSRSAATRPARRPACRRTTSSSARATEPCTVAAMPDQRPVHSAAPTPNLTPETATSKTAGMVWSPKWVDGLDFSLDWYNVHIEDTIVADSATASCATATFAASQSRCQAARSRVMRHGTSPDMFVRPHQRRWHPETEGYDFGVNYRLPEFSVGKFSVNWQTTYTSMYDQQGRQCSRHRMGRVRRYAWRVPGAFEPGPELGEG